MPDLQDIYKFVICSPDFIFIMQIRSTLITTPETEALLTAQYAMMYANGRPPLLLVDAEERSAPECDQFVQGNTTFDEDQMVADAEVDSIMTGESDDEGQNLPVGLELEAEGRGSREREFHSVTLPKDLRPSGYSPRPYRKAPPTPEFHTFRPSRGAHPPGSRHSRQGSTSFRYGSYSSFGR